MLLQGTAAADAGAAGGTRTRFAIMRMPDGSFAFYDQDDPDRGPLTLPDRQGNPHTLLPALPTVIRESQAVAESRVLANTQVVLTPENHVVSVYVKGEALDRETASKVGLPRFLNVWVTRSSSTEASQPRMIWQGYNGSQMEYQQLPSGRILVPYGSFQPHAKPVPPTGRHVTIVQYSDDDGQTWKESESRLTSPCYPGFNGNNEGACEPAIEPLSDGRIWMLMRTQAGFLYESMSHDDGTTWQQANASRFHTSTGPPNIFRYPTTVASPSSQALLGDQDWLVVTWNNCEMPPRHEGQGVYGGRDALHIAVSDDEGRTWRGFREIYLDHRRHENPASTGDRGTAYPLGAYTKDGRIVVLAGQGHGGRNPIVIDPAWIIATESHTDFSDGLAQWSVYKHHGPAQRWWRARAVGCELVSHPQDSAQRCLHIRKPDDLPADGAVWNFPNGWKGTLTARVMIRPGFQGGRISLNDRMFDPTNDWGEKCAIYGIQLASDGHVGTAVLQPDTWHDITLRWDLDIPECQLVVDGKDAGRVPLRNETLNGMSYVRFRSTSTEIDSAGFLLERVNVNIEDPYAPAISREEQLAHERRYIENIVPLWMPEESP
jgi:hypothetical protein